MPRYNFRVNGRAVTVDSWDSAQPLLYALRNSLARRLGLPTAGLPPATRSVEGLVEVLLDAYQLGPHGWPPVPP